ncbi:MAG TPA: Stk1 family PASTA domain-containing Ser/Thr kinase [Oscillospiraceae bacterium]|jgi:serine/threonine protein kinase|nr:Stk1 family PASTA domain-containing Ser/Thr kinase [Oscillospiraceae bacterium]
MDNYVGKRLDGRYEIQEIVGVGGMSVVYKAYDNVDDRVVAVKILKDEFLTNDDFVRRFKNESKAIALLSHPNIVKVYDVSFGEKLQYIVMEYVDGITLKEYIQKQGAITWNDALFFTTQILKALQHAHDKGIVHRDIKPQNIILLPNGNIKVADFGIARFSRSETRTLTDTAIGSVHYISPEQAKGEFTDEKADIYSVGVVLYEMLAGKVPFEAESAVSVALMQLQNNAKRLTEINPDIPLGLEQICIHAMEKDPKDRYQSATEMLLDVEEVINNPKTVFDYSCFVDKSPTKYISNTDKITAETPVINEKPIEKAVDSDEDEVEYYDPDHKKKVVSAVLIGIIILVTAAVLLVMAITGSFKTSTNTLDNFVGFSYDELISSNKYDYEFVLEQKKTDEVEPGIVVDQSPEAGSKVISGSQVKLVVSASMDDINVPNIYNLNDEKAKKALANEGLTNYKFTTISSETVEEGLVVYTEPKAGTVVSSDTQIVVFVSSGPTTKEVVNIEVPDVTGLKQEGARAFLEKMGFKNVNFVTQDDLRPKGVVISQSPAAGSSATADDKIKVVISSGETTTTTKPTSKVSLSVSLPKIVNESGEYITDTLEVTIDGETYLNQAVTLNGTNASVSITLDGENEANVKVSLTDIGALETKTVSPKKSMNLKVDFSGFSNEKTTLSSNDSQTVQASDVNGAQ